MRNTAKLFVVLQNENHYLIPPTEDFRMWVSTVMERQDKDIEVVIRIVDRKESSELNETYRAKQGPTNVLSFTADLPDYVKSPLLGDLVICAEIIHAEAKEQGKKVNAHWAHMVIHGMLHLLGYDHKEQTQRLCMEAKEIKYLQQLEISNPYYEGHHATN